MTTSPGVRIVPWNALKRNEEYTLLSIAAIRYRVGQKLVDDSLGYVLYHTKGHPATVIVPPHLATFVKLSSSAADEFSPVYTQVI